MRLADIMVCPAVTIELCTTVEQARALMRKQDFQHLPVLDGGKLVGIVSDRDIHTPRLARQWHAMTWIDEIAVEWIMSSPVIALRPDAPVSEAAKIMRERKIGCIPVVGDGRLLGIVTVTDLLNLLDPASGALLYPPHPHRIDANRWSHFDG